jgi:hypothetical protein
MDLLTRARRLEARIARTLDNAAHRAVGSPPRDPLQVLHAIVEVVEQEVQPAGRGRRVFPYNSVVVRIAAASPQARARYSAVIDGPPPLHERLADALRSAGADATRLDVLVAYAPEARPGWTAPEFHVEFAHTGMPVDPEPQPAPPPLGIELTVLRGAAHQAAYSLALARIDIGRGAEVRDTRNHLLRTNHVAFVDAADEVTNSVSRRHAHITCDAASGHCRIHDDGSAHGTSVLRGGATIAVRTGARGIRLRDGDEIVLGEARLRVSL